MLLRTLLAATLLYINTGLASLVNIEEEPAAFFYNPTNSLGLEKYQQILKEVNNLYSPIFARKNLKLTIKTLWDSDRMNLLATRDLDDNPIIKIHGGMLRHELLTEDALRLFICHELGHFLGGAPKSHRASTQLLSWSSTEGQADYFATAKCLKRLFANDEQNREKIGASFNFAEDKQSESGLCAHNAQCIRILRASQQSAKIYADIKRDLRPLSLVHKNPHQVHYTREDHGDAQCRLDTFVAGALCNKSPLVDFHAIKPTIGACLKEEQPHGARPQCWYSGP